jgi:hypothetical protein
MKYLFSVLLVLASFSKAVAASDGTLATSNTVTQSQPSFGFNLDPIWLAVSGIGGKAEYFISDKVSIGIGGILIPSHKVEKTSSEDTAKTVGGDYKWEHNEIFVGSNFMLTGTLGSNGLYINPAVGYQSTKITEYSDENLSGSLSNPMVRLTMGYQWVLAKHLRLAAGGGFALAAGNNEIVVKDSSGTEVLREKSSSMGALALDLQVGYVF